MADSMDFPDYSIVKVIKDGQVTFRDASSFPRSNRLTAKAAYQREYLARRRDNNGGPISLESARKLYLSEMPHMGGGS